MNKFMEEDKEAIEFTKMKAAQFAQLTLSFGSAL
jgi:hypothetical protein